MESGWIRCIYMYLKKKLSWRDCSTIYTTFNTIQVPGDIDGNATLVTHKEITMTSDNQSKRTRGKTFRQEN